MTIVRDMSLDRLFAEFPLNGSEVPVDRMVEHLLAMYGPARRSPVRRTWRIRLAQLLWQGVPIPDLAKSHDLSEQEVEQAVKQLVFRARKGQ